MKILIYAGAELMTGDDIAEAVLEYCAALAVADAAEIMRIPVVESDGSITGARLLLGPASQVVAKDVETDWPELEDESTMERLMSRTQAQRTIISVQPQTAKAHDYGAWTDAI